jgi:hypothetical protein
MTAIEGVGGEDHAECGQEAEARLDERQGRQAVAGQERQTDRESDGDDAAEPHGGADHQADDLADRAAGQAVDGRAEREAVARAPALHGLTSLVLTRLEAGTEVAVRRQPKVLPPKYYTTRCNAGVISRRSEADSSSPMILGVKHEKLSERRCREATPERALR